MNTHRIDFARAGSQFRCNKKGIELYRLHATKFFIRFQLWTNFSDTLITRDLEDIANAHVSRHQKTSKITRLQYERTRILQATASIAKIMFR